MSLTSEECKTALIEIFKELHPHLRALRDKTIGGYLQDLQALQVDNTDSVQVQHGSDLSGKQMTSVTTPDAKMVFTEEGSEEDSHRKLTITLNSGVGEIWLREWSGSSPLKTIVIIDKRVPLAIGERQEQNDEVRGELYRPFIDSDWERTWTGDTVHFLDPKRSRVTLPEASTGPGSTRNPEQTTNGLDSAQAQLPACTERCVYRSTYTAMSDFPEDQCDNLFFTKFREFHPHLRALRDKTIEGYLQVLQADNTNSVQVQHRPDPSGKPKTVVLVTTLDAKMCFTKEEDLQTLKITLNSGVGGIILIESADKVIDLDNHQEVIREYQLPNGVVHGHIYVLRDSQEHFVGTWTGKTFHFSETNRSRHTLPELSTTPGSTYSPKQTTNGLDSIQAQLPPHTEGDVYPLGSSGNCL